MNLASPEQRLLRFVHYLRANDFSIGIAEANDVISSLNQLSEPEPKFSKIILRSLTCRKIEEWRIFDQLFNQYWFPNGNVIQENSNAKNARDGSGRKRQSGLTGLAGSSFENINILNEESGLCGSGAGKQTTITKADFRFITNKRQMRHMENMAEKLALSLRKRISRKYVYRNHGHFLDMRRTIRRNLNHGGILHERIFKQRDYISPNLLILHDVSHSMSWNNPLLFRFARGLIRTFPSSEAFAFHTSLFRVSEIYRQRSLQSMKESLEKENRLWLGGTCIAKSLRDFNQQYASDFLKSNSIVIIISDGFDTDEADKLTEELFNIRGRAKKIIWLSPVLDRISSMNIADSKPSYHRHIDLLLPAHSLFSLQESLEKIRQYC